MKHGIIIACLIGLMAAVGARAADEPAAKPPGEHKPPAPLMDAILMPRTVEDLALTPEQKAKYDDLSASFKKDAAKWRADNNYDPEKAREEMRKAREAKDQEAMKKLADQRKGLADLRKGYVDKVRAFLTDDQKAKLDKAVQGGPGRWRGGPNTDTKPSAPPPPAPSDK